MLEPLVWMFRNKDFKKRFLQLCLTLIVALLILIGLLFSTNVIEFTFLNGQILNILFTVVCFFTSLIIQGYFWELTSNIISRNWDISASNVYSGKIKERFFIDLPKFRYHSQHLSLVRNSKSTIFVFPRCFKTKEHDG